MKAHFEKERPQRAKLIFNPISGAPGQSPVQLMDVITEMQAWNLAPEVFLIEHGRDLLPVVREAVRQGIRLFVVSGGDGTVDTVAGALAGTRATLGIIPTGTQNNVALSLGIPEDIPGAVSLLRAGRRVKVDLGLAACGEIERPFLEVCSVGLLSALFPAADDIQHGNLARIGELLSALVSSPPAELRLELDKGLVIETQGHVVLAANMPYTGPHFQIASTSAHQDGLLDLLVFSNLSKLELLTSAVQIAGGGTQDERIHRFQVHRAAITTQPPMPILADGISLGEGPLRLSVLRHALNVMVGEPPADRGEPELLAMESRPVPGPEIGFNADG